MGFINANLVPNLLRVRAWVCNRFASKRVCDKLVTGLHACETSALQVDLPVSKRVDKNKLGLNFPYRFAYRILHRKCSSKFARVFHAFAPSLQTTMFRKLFPHF